MKWPKMKQIKLKNPFSRVKGAVGEKIKERAQKGMMVSHELMGKRIIDYEYKRLFKECDKVIEGNGNPQYWKKTVLGRYFGKNTKGTVESEQSARETANELYTWLPGFVSRLKEKEVSAEDKRIITDSFIPFMKHQQEKELTLGLERFGVGFKGGETK